MTIETMTTTTIPMTTAAAAEFPAGVLDGLRAQLDRIETKLDAVLAARQVKDWYTTREVADRMGVADDTVREWCRFARVRADKRKSGQGPARPWMISHAELERLSNEGLLPLRLARD